MLYCWAIMPLAAVQSARIIVVSCSYSLLRFGDLCDRRVGGVVLGLDRFFVGVEPTLGRNQIDHLTDDVAVAHLEHALLNACASSRAGARVTGDCKVGRAFGAQ